MGSSECDRGDGSGRGDGRNEADGASRPDEQRLAEVQGANYGDGIVNVRASGVAANDLERPSTGADRRGHDRAPSIPAMSWPGWSALGYGTTSVVGGRVLDLTDWTRDGTLAGYVVEARNLAPPPADVDFTDGAGVAMTG